MKKIKQMKKIVILKSTASFNSFLNEQSKALLVALYIKTVFFSKLIEYFFLHPNVGFQRSEATHGWPNREQLELYGIKSERVVFTSALLLFIYSKNALAYYTTTQPTPLIKVAPPRKIYDFEVIGERRMWNWLRVPLEKSWLKNILWSDYIHVFKFKGFVVSGHKPCKRRSRADKHPLMILGIRYPLHFM